jgi:hypothetical protein
MPVTVSGGMKQVLKGATTRTRLSSLSSGWFVRGRSSSLKLEVVKWDLFYRGFMLLLLVS